MYFAPSKNGGTGHIADRLKTLRRSNETRVRETHKKSDAPKPFTIDVINPMALVDNYIELWHRINFSNNLFFKYFLGSKIKTNCIYS